MIEATCSACGTLNRVSEANVPVGARFITCADCKSRIAIQMPPVPPLPKLPSAIPGTARSSNVLDLTDLPAPKRSSALGPLPVPPARVAPLKPVQRGSLAAALDPELPAPKATRSAAPTQSQSIDFDEPALGQSIDDSIDLPAPKRASSRIPVLDSSRPVEAPVEIVDLPAPKVERNVSDLPVPKPIRRAVPDLPKRDPPRRPPPELLAPEAPAVSSLPSPRAPEVAATPAAPEALDLPGPKGALDDLPQSANQHHSDLPAPKGFFDDIPQVKSNPSRAARAAAPRSPISLSEVGPGAAGDIAEVPTPGGFFDDLPQPRSGSGAITDLPAPKGYFDDIPQVKSHPSGGITDVPAPKGYFDDIPGLPHTARPEVPAPKGFFDDIPQVKSHPSGGVADVPAPKGFFDDIPGLPHIARPEVPAPKGFFDDIPGLPHTARPEVPAPKGLFDDIPGLPHTAGSEAPAPRGFFDDVTARSEAPAPRGFFDDLPRPTRPPNPARAAGADPVLQLDAEPEPEIEIDLVSPAASTRSFDDLELSKPSASATRFDPPQRAAPPPVNEARVSDAGPVLELEGASAISSARALAQRPLKARPASEDAGRARDRTGRNRIALIGLLAVVALGGGGFVLYQRHVAAVERQAAIAEQLGIARAAYAAVDPQHWQRAATAARRVVDLDETNAEAMGIGAESLLASAFADGTATAGKIGQARALLDAASSGGISTAMLTRARALAVLAGHQADAAVSQLRPLAQNAPRDAVLALYLGWALAAKGDLAAAIEAYDRAAGDPAAKLAGLYGRGSARLALGDLDGARSDFTAVLELSKDHIGAQVGLAAAQPSSAGQRREADLLAILARKDIATADPRAVAQAWTLAGDAALRAGRFDVARERFRKALAEVHGDLGATAGLAETELRDGKLALAADLTATALTSDKDNVAAQLVQSEIEIKQHRLPLAHQRLTALASRASRLAPLEQARLHLVTGKLLEAQGKDDEAADAYVAGAKVARELDLEPMVAAVGKLAALTKAAVAERDQPRADALRIRADDLLGNFAEQAARDPQLALTLGVGYLQAGNAEKAEPWLRRAVEGLPRDAEARFQLGRALLRSERPSEALEALNAAVGIDPLRADIAADLAHTYEVLGRDADAGALYSKLLAGPAPSLELRARGGRFFARAGQIGKAAEQAARILEVDPRHPDGLYLKGEGLLAAGKPLDAKQQFQRALEADRDPRYLDALGRAAEAMAQGGDRDAQELALRSYQAALEAVPAMLTSLIGQGRLYVARHEAAKALAPLRDASQIDPRNADIKFLLGAAYQELQQPAMARQWLEESTRIAPNAEAYWRLGQIERDANHGQQAVAALTSATRLALESEKRTGKPVAWLTEALYLEGRVSFDLHNEATAREAWLQYIARSPTAGAQLTEVRRELATSLRH